VCFGFGLKSPGSRLVNICMNPVSLMSPQGLTGTFTFCSCKVSEGVDTPVNQDPGSLAHIWRVQHARINNVFRCCASPPSVQVSSGSSSLPLCPEAPPRAEELSARSRPLLPDSRTRWPPTGRSRNCRWVNGRGDAIYTNDLAWVVFVYPGVLKPLACDRWISSKPSSTTSLRRCVALWSSWPRGSDPTPSSTWSERHTAGWSGVGSAQKHVSKWTVSITFSFPSGPH